MPVPSHTVKAADAGELGRLRAHDGTAQRGVRRVLVHVVPHHGRREGDWRITCIFVDKKHRRRGVSAIALRGVLDLVAQAGGGVVEDYPHDTQGARQSVLYDGTRALFERAGFEHVRPKGTKNCVMRTMVR